MATILTRTAIIYLLLILSLRIMGKRQIGELQASELVTTFMLSELAVTPIQDSATPLLYAIVPILFLLSAEVILSFFTIRWNPLKKLFCEKPSILVKNGCIDQAELARLRISVTELLSELRQKDVADVQEVAYAILEENGKLSVFLRPEAEPLTARDMKMEKKWYGIAHPVIIDGAKSPVNMTLANITEKDLQRELKRQRAELREIFLMTVDDDKQFHTVRKDIK